MPPVWLAASVPARALHAKWQPVGTQPTGSRCSAAAPRPLDSTIGMLCSPPGCRYDPQASAERQAAKRQRERWGWIHNGLIIAMQAVLQLPSLLCLLWYSSMSAAGNIRFESSTSAATIATSPTSIYFYGAQLPLVTRLGGACVPGPVRPSLQHGRLAAACPARLPPAAVPAGLSPCCLLGRGSAVQPTLQARLPARRSDSW